MTNRDTIWKKTCETYQSAGLCFRNDCFNSAISRYYYACAQGATYAILQRIDDLPSELNHKKIRNLFHELFRSDFGKGRDVLIELHDLRQIADYTDREVSKAKVEHYKRKLISEFMSFIVNKFNLSIK